MKSLRESVRSMMVVSMISLLFVAPVLAQQEVSPDRFESGAPQNGRTTTRMQKKSPAHVSAKKHTAKVRHSTSTGNQVASLKTSSNYKQIASN